MSKRMRKLRNRLARQVIDGDITVTEARLRLGLAMMTTKSAGPEVAKSAGPAAGGYPATVPRYPGDPEYAGAAFAPIPRPVVTKTAVPGRRESPAQVLKALKDASMLTPAAAAPRAMTPVERNQLAALERISDPVSREQARSSLIARLEGAA